MKQIIYLFCILILLSCSRNNRNSQKEIIVKDSVSTEKNNKNEESGYSSGIMLQLESSGLIDVQKLNPRILVELKYATIDNFTGKILYDSLKNAYLQPDVAKMVVKAQKHLDSIRPGMQLLIYDAVRPVHIQRKMYDSVKGTPYQAYVANPERTGLHNYGAAVDLTICDSSNNPLDMGTPFDSFSHKSGINKEDSLILLGLLTKEQVENRRLLRKVMLHAGFQTVRGEWWHFNACSLNEAKRKYKLIEN